MTASPRRFSMESSNRRLSNDRQQRPFQGNATYTQSIRPQQHTSSTLGEDDYPREPIPSPYEETQGFSSNEYATPQYSKEDEMQDGSFYHGYGGAGTYVGQGSPLRRGGDHFAAGYAQNAVYVGGKTAINPQSNVDTTSHNVSQRFEKLIKRFTTKRCFFRDTDHSSAGESDGIVKHIQTTRLYHLYWLSTVDSRSDSTDRIQGIIIQ